jgi:putative ABC transport system permease protein
LQRVPLGFTDPDHLLTARITRSLATQESYSQDVVFYKAMIEEVRALPGVLSAGLSSELPFGDFNTTMSAGTSPPVEGQPAQGVQSSWRVVTGDYLRTMKVPVIHGRIFDEWKDPTRSMMVSETLARRLWPDGRYPLGTRVWLGNRQAYTLIGVVGDVRQIGLADDPTPTVYLSPRWLILPTMALVVRTAGDPAALAQPIRAAIARVDPRQPVADFSTMRNAVAGNAAEPRLNSLVLASFAGLALLLASVGVAGVVSYSVGQRTSEIAVRLALGSSAGQAVRLVMRAGLGLCAAGIAAGLFVALVLGRAMSGVLYGVQPHDPFTLAAAAVVLSLVALAACWFPARRATRISPAMALRS